MYKNTSPPNYESGQWLAQRYVLAECIGHGGHGVVYKAFDTQMQKYVAIKLLHRKLASDPEFNLRLLREVQATRALTGTAAVEVYALSSDEYGSLFIVMELLNGESLESYTERFEQQGQFVPISHLNAIFSPIIQTLEHAHTCGIIHRDLKPSNIFVLASPPFLTVKLFDFGLAKVMNATPLTRQGMIAGSPSYIAPEVWDGDPQTLDHRIDVYSLGVILFRTLGGQTPFSGSIPELMRSTLQSTRPSLHRLRPLELPQAVDFWVQQALAIDRTHRFQSVRELWNSLCSLLSL